MYDENSSNENLIAMIQAQDDVLLNYKGYKPHDVESLLTYERPTLIEMVIRGGDLIDLMIEKNFRNNDINHYKFQSTRFLLVFVQCRLQCPQKVHLSCCKLLQHRNQMVLMLAQMHLIDLLNQKKVLQTEEKSKVFQKNFFFLCGFLPILLFF